MATALSRLPRSAFPVSRWLRAIAALLVAALITLQGSAAAFATTGSTTLAPPTYRVPLSQAKPYCGHYTLQHASSAAHFTGGAMAITIGAQGALVGLLQMYGKDAQEYATTWVATLYNFRVLSQGQTSVEIFGAGYSVRLGRMTLTRNTNGDLSGQITLGTPGYAIQWHRLASH